MSPLDRWTQMVSKLFEILLTDSPRRTGLGSAIGLALYWIILVLERVLKNPVLAEVASAPFWGWVVLGIVIMHARTIGSILTNPSTGNDQVESAIRVIEHAKFSPSEARQQYRLLVKKVIDNLVLTHGEQPRSPNSDSGTPTLRSD